MAVPGASNGERRLQAWKPLATGSASTVAVCPRDTTRRASGLAQSSTAPGVPSMSMIPSWGVGPMRFHRTKEAVRTTGLKFGGGVLW